MVRSLIALVSFSLLSCSDSSTGKPGEITDAGKSHHDAAPASCPDAGAGTYFPCDVGSIIHAKCQRCHDTMDALQPCLADNSCLAGPFPLDTWSDTRRNLGGGTRVVDLIE